MSTKIKLKTILTLFNGIEASDTFKAPDKDYAKMMKDRFDSESPYEFFQSLNDELLTIIDMDNNEQIEEEEVDNFLADLGKIIMLYIKHRDKTPPIKKRPISKPAKQVKNTYKKKKDE